jgi:murein DD-endopeptidase MepM/ murein hydrolase activator NlpD
MVWLTAIAVIVPGHATSSFAAMIDSPPVVTVAVPPPRLLSSSDAATSEMAALLGYVAPAADSTAVPVAVGGGGPDLATLIDITAAMVASRSPGWFCPISSPVRFEDTYGEGRNGGRRHLGVDLTAPMGTPTVAPVSGTVRYSKDAAGGLSWHLDGDDGVYYYGTHLSKFGSVTGRVEQGTVIGYVGMSGNASLPHLHLEIHPGGITAPAINPTPTAARYCNNSLPAH